MSILNNKTYREIEAEVLPLTYMFGEYDHVNFENIDGRNVFIVENQDDLKMILDNELMKEVNVREIKIGKHSGADICSVGKIGFEIPNNNDENVIKRYLFRYTKLI